MSVEAMAWARLQVVGDAHAKSLLRAIADYADEHGHCFPSLGRLANDCELSEDTIRRKAAMLEDGGYLVRIKTWMDEHGRRNTERRGRETSQEIRLHLARVAAPVSESGENEGLQAARVAGCEGSSVQGAGLQGATPGVAVVPPPNEPSSKREEDSPPKPPHAPSEGEAGQPSREETEAGQNLDGLDTFIAAYPIGSNHPARRDAAWAVLGSDERAVATRGAAGLRAVWDREPKRRPAVLAPERFLADAAVWAEWARYAPPEPKAEPPKPRVTLPVNGPEHTAVAICCIIADRPVPRGRPGPDGDEFDYGGDVPAGADAMAQLVTTDASGKIDTSHWQAVHAGTPMCAAWRDRVAEWLGVAPEIRRFWLNEAGQIVPTAANAHKPPGALIPKSMNGLLVPVTATGFPPPKGKHDPPGDAEHEADAETD